MVFVTRLVQPASAGGTVETVKGTISGGRTAVFFTYVDVNGELHENLMDGTYNIPKNSICLISGDRTPTVTGGAQNLSGTGFFITGDFSAITP